MGESGRKWLADQNPAYLLIANMLAIEDENYFPKSQMIEEIINSMDASSWWKIIGMTGSIKNQDFLELVENLMILPASSSGIERIFSGMGNIITKTRNRLGLEKAEKLCFIFYYLKSNH
jgi:hAT family C-terminal dimerisation region